jgi:hypothetical protein
MTIKKGQIRIEEGDAVEFIHQVNSIMEALVDRRDIGEVVFVKIKNWFDQKWLAFSGKSLVHFPIAGLLDSSGREEALECVSSKEVTIPPFNPNRVLSSKFLRVRDTGNKRIEKALHGYRRSTETARNLVKDYTSDGLLLWYSSNTLANQKGSIMVYTSQNNKVSSWYARFENIDGWKVTRAKGIKLTEIEDLSNERRSVII